MKTSQIELSNLEILRSLQALQAVNSDGIEFDMTYTMSLNLKALRKASEDYQEFRTGIFKEYAELTERGEPIIDEETQKYVFKSNADETAALDKVQQLNDAAVSLDLYCYPLSSFRKAKIPHTLLEHLTWMVRDEEAPAAKQPKRKVGR